MLSAVAGLVVIAAPIAAFVPDKRKTEGAGYLLSRRFWVDATAERQRSDGGTHWQRITPALTGRIENRSTGT